MVTHVCDRGIPAPSTSSGQALAKTGLERGTQGNVARTGHPAKGKTPALAKSGLERGTRENFVVDKLYAAWWRPC